MPGGAFKTIKPENLNFNNELKITKTKTESQLNALSTSMKMKMGVHKLDEFDVNQEKRDRSPSNDIKSPASVINHFN